ncbi:MAG: hypothetical protein JSR44_02015 [Spirochaetes bacterium]|nr:hypothetical protein [Spirochaetota bacterium]
MKPLDLNVSIQNSYEAARTESVRLDQAHVSNVREGEAARREQLLRDSSVVAPEANQMAEDLFTKKNYEGVEYSVDSDASRHKRRDENKKKSEKSANEKDETAAAKEESDAPHGFSTYA